VSARARVCVCGRGVLGTGLSAGATAAACAACALPRICVQQRTLHHITHQLVHRLSPIGSAVCVVCATGTRARRWLLNGTHPTPTHPHTHTHARARTHARDRPVQGQGLGRRCRQGAPARRVWRPRAHVVPVHAAHQRGAHPRVPRRDGDGAHPHQQPRQPGRDRRHLQRAPRPLAHARLRQLGLHERERQRGPAAPHQRQDGCARARAGVVGCAAPGVWRRRRPPAVARCRRQPLGRGRRG
jgi:hypothetical protein